MHCVNRNHHSTVWRCSRRPVPVSALARRGRHCRVPRRGLWRGAHRGRANVDHDVDQMCMPICTLGLNLRFDLCLPWRHCACARTGLDPRAVVFVRHLRSSRMLRSTRVGVVGHRGAGAWFWHLVPLLLKVLLHNRATTGVRRRSRV